LADSGSRGNVLSDVPCFGSEKHADAVPHEDTTSASAAVLPAPSRAFDIDAIRGIEGQAAALYFDVFGDMLTVPTEEFSFKLRTRRPPRDRVNALLSFLYALLTNDCTAACEGVGLDPQFGFLHCLRPGRPSLALDLMEEFRAFLADRLVLTLINRRQIRPEHFEDHPGDSVTLTEEGRKAVLGAYQTRKQEEVAHPLLKEKAPIGLLPHLQARLLARHLRGDLADYIPFLA
jgi:CRISPR-associated protein Cas1